MEKRKFNFFHFFNFRFFIAPIDTKEKIVYLWIALITQMKKILPREIGAFFILQY